MCTLQKLTPIGGDLNGGQRMRRSFYIVASCIALLVSSVAVMAIDLCAFRSPETDLTSFFMTLNYSYVDLPTTPDVDVNFGRTSLSLAHSHDDPDFAFSVGVDAEISVDRFRIDRILGDAFLSSRAYLTDAAPLFLSAELKADTGDAFEQSGMEFRLGAGYGRMSDVSPLARAINIERALLDALVLSGPLSDDALVSVGSLIGREGEFQGIGALVAEIQSVIVLESAAVLDTRALLAIAEQIRSDVASQQCGWITRFGFGYELLPRFGGKRMPLLSLSTDLARPLGLLSQVGVHADVSAPITLPMSGAYALTTSAEYRRRLSESVQLLAEYTLQRRSQPGSPATSGESLEGQVLLDLGRVDLTVSGVLNRSTGTPGWTEQVSVSIRVDLL